MNWSLTSKFIVQRGLWQRDLLAPFLFNVVTEGLRGTMRKTNERNIFSSFLVGEQKVEVTMKSMLWCFELTSGLKVNFHKSYLVGVDGHTLERFTTLLNCKITNLSFLYLGVPIGGNPRLEETWKPIVDKVARRLNSWNHRTLSLSFSCEKALLKLVGLNGKKFVGQKHMGD